MTRRSSIRFIFRGAPVEIFDAPPRETLLDWLRVQKRATGTKEGCAEGDCGACTVVLARIREGQLVHEPVNACILLLGQADGAEVLTVEDLADGSTPHPLQDAMVRHHASQCGFCTPGIVMSLFALQHDGARPVTRDDVCDQLAGNLCRCTGYRPIVDAALEVCAAPVEDQFNRAEKSRRVAIEALADGVDIMVGDAHAFFAAPASEDAFATLYADHPDALIVSGATDVGLWITKGLRDPRKIIWTGRIAGFDAVDRGVEGLSLMAGVRLDKAAPALAAVHADLGEIMRRFGSTQVRASGTVGGSIANGSPIGDLAPCLIALGGRVELRKGNSARELPLEDFFIAYRKQDRAPGEFVRRLTVPALAPSSAFRAFKISKRFDEDISAVLGAFHLMLDGRRVAAARIAYGGMAGTPARARKTEAACVGLDLDAESTWSVALDALAADYAPLSDMRASSAYRSLVARNLLRKSLMEIGGADIEKTRIARRGWAHAAE